LQSLKKKLFFKKGFPNKSFIKKSPFSLGKRRDIKKKRSLKKQIKKY